MKNRVSSFLKLAAFAATGTLCCFGSGCATILNGGGTQEVKIDSIPSGAEVLVTGVLKGRTPMTLEVDLAPSKPTIISLRTPGYAETVVGVQRDFRWGLLMLSALTIVGGPIDISYGAIYPYKVTDITVPLLKPGEDNYWIYDENVLLVNKDKELGRTHSAQ